MQRVNLGDDGADPTTQCAFSAVSRSTGVKRYVGPQVFLTVDPAGPGTCMTSTRTTLAREASWRRGPASSCRSDLGTGAFTLTATTVPVTSAYFLLGKGGVGTLTVDLGGAPLSLRDPDTADKVFALVHGRLH